MPGSELSWRELSGKNWIKSWPLKLGQCFRPVCIKWSSPFHRQHHLPSFGRCSKSNKQFFLGSNHRDSDNSSSCLWRSSTIKSRTCSCAEPHFTNHHTSLLFTPCSASNTFIWRSAHRLRLHVHTSVCRAWSERLLLTQPDHNRSR